MKESRKDLDTDNAGKEETDEKVRGGFRRVSVFDEIFLCGREHAVQRGEELQTLASTSGFRITAGFAALTMTPELRLSEADRKPLLFVMLNDFLPGSRRTKMSIQMMLEPRTQAIQSVHFLSLYQVSVAGLTYPTHTGENPATSVIIEHHLGAGNAILRGQLFVAGLQSELPSDVVRVGRSKS